MPRIGRACTKACSVGPSGMTKQHSMCLNSAVAPGMMRSKNTGADHEMFPSPSSSLQERKMKLAGPAAICQLQHRSHSLGLPINQHHRSLRNVHWPA